MQQQGSNAKLIYQTETTFKTTPVSKDAVIMTFISESLRQNRNLITSKSIRSDRNPQKPVRGNVEIAGDISFELAPQHGRLLHHIFGSYTGASGEAGKFTHTFKIGQLPTGMIVEKQFTDLATPEYFQYHGCKVNSFKMSCKTEGFIECSVNLMGAKEEVAAASFDSTPDDLGHTPWDGFSAVIKEATVAVAIATQIDFTLDNGLDGNTYVIDGTGERHSMPAGTVKVSGTLTVLFEDLALYNKALNNTETSLELALTSGTGDGSAGNEKLTFYMDEILFHPQAPVVSGPAGVLVELPFEAYYNDDADASALRAVMLSPTSYYG